MNNFFKYNNNDESEVNCLRITNKLLIHTVFSLVNPKEIRSQNNIDVELSDLSEIMEIILDQIMME